MFYVRASSDLWPGGTLLSVLPQNFCRQMLLDLKSKPRTVAKSL